MNRLQFFVHNDPDAVRVELAGSLRGPDVETVRQAWERVALLSAQVKDPVGAVDAVNTHTLKPVIADITFITDVDEDGRALLFVMRRFGVRIVAQSPESSAIARQILAGPTAPLTAQSSYEAEFASLKPANG